MQGVGNIAGLYLIGGYNNVVTTVVSITNIAVTVVTTTGVITISNNDHVNNCNIIITVIY